MKTLAIVLGAVALAAVLVIAGFAARAAWIQARAADAAPGEGPAAYDLGYGSGYGLMGPGRMGYSTGDCGPGYGPGYGMMSPWNGACRSPGQGSTDSLEAAAAAFEAYVDDLGYSGLAVTEVMEFEHNYYAIAAQEESGIGAMELLLDKDSGVVGPEPGPNMMWNARYGMMGQRGGMMGGMMGRYATGEMALSPEEAEEVAQRWLDADLPGTTAGEADAFYGYYTLHFLGDTGEIEGMLSVHGVSGDVWYHSWHGDFLAMAENHS